MDLIQGIQIELVRNREILQVYEDLGPCGMFGATMIKGAISRAEQAIADGDTVAMVRACKELQETE